MNKSSVSEIHTNNASPAMVESSNLNDYRAAKEQIVIPTLLPGQPFDINDHTPYDPDLGFVPFFEKYRTSVVEIDQSKTEPHGHKEIRTSGETAFFVKPNIVCTTLHALSGPKNLSIRTDGGKIYPAKLIGVDKTNDIAFLRVEAGSRSFTPLPLGSCDSVGPQRGTNVMSYPNHQGILFYSPGNMSYRSTFGYVCPDYLRQVGGEVNPDAQVWVMEGQTQHGSSGGPVIDDYGQVLGMVEGGLPKQIAMRPVEAIKAAMKKLNI